MGTQVHRLFFALRPDAALLRDIEHAVDSIKAREFVHGRWLKSAKLHLTLQFLGDFIEAGDVIERARRAGASVRREPFEFTLDHVATFARRFNPPCVLRCAAESEHELRSFHDELGAALCAEGLGEHLDRRPYAPHLTIAYADNALAAPVPIEPIVWRACGFTLMDSRVGQSVHAPVETWPLRG